MFLQQIELFIQSTPALHFYTGCIIVETV